MNKLLSYYASFLLIVLVSCLVSLSACDKLTPEQLQSAAMTAKHGAAAVGQAYCSAEMAAEREKLMALAKEKFPAYPVFDVCPLITN